jgi:hypothetical protein
MKPADISGIKKKKRGYLKDKRNDLTPNNKNNNISDRYIGIN